jgi:hypothetical protein
MINSEIHNNRLESLRINGQRAVFGDKIEKNIKNIKERKFP